MRLGVLFCAEIKYGPKYEVHLHIKGQVNYHIYTEIGTVWQFFVQISGVKCYDHYFRGCPVVRFLERDTALLRGACGVWENFLKFQWPYVHLERKGPQILSVKLGDFISWCHTWRKNLVNCAITQASQLSFPIVFHTHRTAQFTQGIPQFPQLTCRHHDGIISRHIRF